MYTAYTIKKYTEVQLQLSNNITNKITTIYSSVCQLPCMRYRLQCFHLLRLTTTCASTLCHITEKKTILIKITQFLSVNGGTKLGLVFFFY